MLGMINSLRWLYWINRLSCRYLKEKGVLIRYFDFDDGKTFHQAVKMTDFFAKATHVHLSAQCSLQKREYQTFYARFEITYPFNMMMYQRQYETCSNWIVCVYVCSWWEYNSVNGLLCRLRSISSCLLCVHVSLLQRFTGNRDSCMNLLLHFEATQLSAG